MNTTTQAQDKSETFKVSVAIDRKFCGETVQAILSTILFLRLFGSLAPTTGEAVGVTYPRIANDETDAMLAAKAREVLQNLNEVPTKSRMLRVEFYERRVKKTAWFAKTHNHCWESWQIELSLSVASTSAPSSLDNFNVSKDTALRKAASSELQRSLMEIVSAADNHKEHIPPITTTDVAPFPYEIIIF